MSGKPQPSPAPAGPTSPVAEPNPAASPIVLERDDFGLPIRPPPSPAAEYDAGQSNEPEKEDEPKRTDGAAEPQTASPEQGPQRGAGNEKNKNNDSDEDDFEDAQSKAGSDSVSRATEVRVEKSEATNVRRRSSKEATPVSPTSASQEQDKEGTTTSPADDKHTAESHTGELSTPTAPKAPEHVKASDALQQTTRIDSTREEASTTSAPTRSNHRQQASLASDTGPSEFSHQAIQFQDPMDVLSSDEKKDDDGWQDMPSYARYDMYDDDDRLIAREHDDAEEQKVQYGGLGGAGKGYTRVQVDDDAESATSMDDNTKYLFKNAKSTSLAEGDDEEARDAVSQMQATKDLLTEGQRIAYVGIVRLEIASITKEREKTDVPRKVRKEVTMASEATKMWGQKMMIRLYAHMDISEAEQVMIEQLAEHGVVPADLTPALLANARVHNPMAASRVSEVIEEEDEEPQDETQARDVQKEPSHQESNDRKDSSLHDSEDDELPAEPPPAYQAVGGEELPDVKTPSQLPTTAELEIDLRWTVLCDLFLTLIADSIYDARSRTLMERVGASLDVPWLDICRFEKRVTDALEMQQAAEKENWNEDEHLEARRKKALKKRYVMMGLATVGGGLVIGLSAGLMAPLIGGGIAAGLTTIGIGSSGATAFFGGVGGAAIITSTAATSGSIIGGRAANRRTGAVKTFEYRPLHNNKRVNLVVTVAGWLTGKMDDVRLPFSTVDPIIGDLYSVLWEPEMLRSMGDTINILATEALTQGLQQVLASTVLTALMSALQLPIVLTKLSYLIDNPWAVSLDRAWSAGQILADSLIERSLGTRPITLVGYSIGARVIFSCLQELAKKGAYGIVQNVYMFGTPIVVKSEEYLRAKTVVSGRFVNGYHRNDWILGYLFRLTNGGIRRVAGLAAIEDSDFVENMDVTEHVKGHMEYRKAMPVLLRNCGFPVESDEFTEIEEPDSENHSQRQRELINEIEEARKELEREGKAGQKSKFALFGRRKKLEKQKWEVYDDKGGIPRNEKQPDGEQGNNHGVLFDIDAIRAELAAEARYGDEEIQVKEIKSTMPPMRIDVSPKTPASTSTTSLPAPRPAPLRDSLSMDHLPPQPSYSARVSRDRGSRSGSPAYLGSPPMPIKHRDSSVDGGIQMTFDTSFDDQGAAPSPPAKSDDMHRPEMKTSQTLPNISLADPWADPEDDDFGKEKEVTMTFA